MAVAVLAEPAERVAVALSVVALVVLVVAEIAVPALEPAVVFQIRLPVVVAVYSRQSGILIAKLLDNLFCRLF